jgi:ubiquinone/menaquinone biosynthesis C-methylase UbiE
MDILNRNFNPASTRKNYKNVAWFYDVWSHLTESKAAKKVLDLADIKEGMAILEVACGTGIVFEEIVKQNPNGKNIGIDLSPHMLAKAQKRMQKNNTKYFELKEGDVFNLNFKDNTFDLLINNFMIDLMPADTFDAIAQTFYKLLKPNGRLVISNFSFGTKRVHKLWFWVAKTFPSLLTGCRPITFKEHLLKVGFNIENEVNLSQNTFPSQVISAIKK